MTERKKVTEKIQIAVLVFFIIFMPLGSWYYLQSGYNYHKELMAELRDYGKLPEFQLLTQNGDSLQIEDLRGKIMLANFYSKGTPTASTSMDYARRILGQFKSQGDLCFLFYNLNSEANDAKSLKDLAEEEELTDKRAYFLSGDQGQLTKLLTSGYKIPLLNEINEGDSITFKKEVTSLPETYPYFALIDSSLVIRNYYDINDKASMNRLVEHLAIILPREKKSKAEHRPQKEK